MFLLLHRQNKIAFICCVFKNTRDSCEQTWSLECIRELSPFYLKLCIIAWYTNMSDWRLTDILELQNHSFPSLFLTMIFNSPDHQGDQTLLIYPGEISSVYLNTRVHLLKIVGYQVGSVSLCNFCSDRWDDLTHITGKQKFKTNHTTSCSVTAVPSCGSRTDRHTGGGAGCSRKLIWFPHLAEPSFIDRAADLTERFGSGSVLAELCTLERKYLSWNNSS